MPYPPSKPYDEGYLKVSDLHTLHYFQAGNPTGKPVVFLHGGPGGNVSEKSTIFFNPEIYRIITYDQRGAGKSTPFCETRENTTQHLVEDTEKLKRHLKVDKWLVFGGSWGSTLGLAYAQTYPSSCKGLVLRGIFLGRELEMEWFNSGARHLFPEAWDKYEAFLPCDGTDLDRAKGFQTLLQSDDYKTRLDAALAWNGWGGFISSFRSPEPKDPPEPVDEASELVHATFENLYTVERCFLEEGQLIRKENIDKIRHLPCIIVQGRYDCICPPRSAWDLKLAWPESEIHFIPSAGHSANDPGVAEALAAATDKLSRA